MYVIGKWLVYIYCLCHILENTSLGDKSHVNRTMKHMEWKVSTAVLSDFLILTDKEAFIYINYGGQIVAQRRCSVSADLLF